MTLGDLEYAGRKKTTRRGAFLQDMVNTIPWEAWIDMIRPHYPSGKRGRQVRGVETMLCMYLLQLWFNLSDVGLEGSIYDSYAMRAFMGIDFLNEQAPDSTSLLKFRHLLEKHGIGKKIFDDLKGRLEKAGMLMHGGLFQTIVQKCNLCPETTVTHVVVLFCYPCLGCVRVERGTGGESRRMCGG